LNFRELAALAPLAALCLWIGVYPKPVLDVIRPDVQAVAKIYEKQTGRPQVEPRFAEVNAGPAVQTVANVEAR
jgi:NADH:ubiquinone oxidoreductase subunit 4 (subunit M)